MQAYTYDANGNRLTKSQGGVTTTYTYNTGGRLVSDGTSTYSYDAAGNLTARGSDTFAYDYASRMTSATMGGATSNYTYDGDDVRVAVGSAGVTSPQLWDRICSGGTCGPSCGGESGPQVTLLVDDGTSGYLWADGLVAELSSSARLDDLGDGLGSVRAWTNAAGATASTADYDVFGTMRSSSGSPGAFRYTGERWDSPTGLEFLRARYHDPAAGRFTSEDMLQPNAPGSQGWNLYAYAANNSTTWTDPTGHNAVAPAMPSAGGSGTDTTAPYAVAAAVLAGGGLQGLGAVIAGRLLYLALVLGGAWVLVDIVDTIEDDPEEQRRKACQDT